MQDRPTSYKSTSAEHRWMEEDRLAWEAAAAELEADGYSRQSDSYYPAMFHKDNAPIMVLHRHLGVLDWHPKEAS